MLQFVDAHYTIIHHFIKDKGAVALVEPCTSQPAELPLTRQQPQLPVCSQANVKSAILREFRISMHILT